MRACMENRRNSLAMPREKARSQKERPEVPMCMAVADRSVVALKPWKLGGAKGAAFSVAKP